MPRLLPRTMTGLVTGACLAAALPLLAGLLLAGIALDRFARHTESLVQDGVRVEQAGATLRDELRDLSRNAEQYFVLGDPALIEVVNGRARAARETIDEIERGSVHPEVASLRLRLADANRAWKSSLDGGASPAQCLNAMRGLQPAAQSVIEAGQATIERQVEEIGRAASVAHSVMAVSALALLPLTALLAYGFSRVTTLPLRQLAAGINALGHGRLRAPIEVAYPEEMRTLGAKLDWLRQRTQSLEEEKERFLRHISHELKTPLATLQEGVALLREQALGALTPRQAEVSHILGDASLELGALIENLLSYAEWKQGETHPGMGWFETQPLFAEVLLSHQLAMSRRHIRVELGGSVPRLYGQRSRLRVALDNLVGNAVKHAPEGSVIDVRAVLAGGRCELSVRDRGRGVAPQEKDKIFEPFVRGTEAEEAAARGTGIGLSIVRETALAHEGTVEVLDAEPGASFRMAWPCPPAQPEL